MLKKKTLIHTLGEYLCTKKTSDGHMQGTAYYPNSAVESTCIWVLTSVMSKRVGLGRSGLVLFYCSPQGQSWGDMSDIPMCPCVFSCSLAAWPCGPSLRDHKRQTGLTEPYCKGLFLKRHCCCLWFMRCWPEVKCMTCLYFFKDLSGKNKIYGFGGFWPLNLPYGSENTRLGYFFCTHNGVFKQIN